MASSITNTLATNSSTGLGTGIDVSQFVQMALANDQANITNFQNQQTALGSQTTALQNITSDLNNLDSAVFALKDPLGALAAQTATSSNTNVLTATASSTATAATHTITVTNLATTSSYYSDAASAGTTVASGSFTLQVGANTAATVKVLGGGSYQIQVGTSTPVTVNNGDATLNGLASAINSQGLGVTASLIQDANGARLSLVSGTSGAPGDLSLSGSLTMGDSKSTVLNFNKAVTGLNASLTVDGVPISSTTNNVSNVINGVTLNLASNSSSPTTLVIAPDTTQASNAINQFVSAYNTAINDINAQFAVSGNGTGGGPLEADSSLRQAQSMLLSAISFAGSGNNGIVNLESMGVSLNDDGTLTVNDGTLANALSSNYSGVQSFLQSTTGGFAGNLNTVLTNLTDNSIGVLGLDAQGISQSSQALSQRISDLQGQLLVKQQNLTQVYAQVNTTLQELPLLQSQLSQQLASA